MRRARHGARSSVGPGQCWSADVICDAPPELMSLRALRATDTGVIHIQAPPSYSGSNTQECSDQCDQSASCEMLRTLRELGRKSVS